VATRKHVRDANVRFGSLADISRRNRHVRCTPESGHVTIKDADIEGALVALMGIVALGGFAVRQWLKLANTGYLVVAGELRAEEFA
jgi:hypothetical protein